MGLHLPSLSVEHHFSGSSLSAAGTGAVYCVVFNYILYGVRNMQMQSKTIKQQVRVQLR